MEIIHYSDTSDEFDSTVEGKSNENVWDGEQPVLWANCMSFQRGEPYTRTRSLPVKPPHA
jgi:hypothetical protein